VLECCYLRGWFFLCAWLLVDVFEVGEGLRSCSLVALFPGNLA